MRVALYTRVSTDEQAKSGYSLEDQLDRLEAHAASRGWEIVARIQDDGLSGTDPNRPGLLQILRLASEGAIDAALAAKRDRFYRSRLLRLATDEDFKELGVRLVALDDTGNMIGDSVLDSFAEWEREIITERTMNGRLKKARKGEVPGGGYAPFGFSWVRNDNEKRAALVVNRDMPTVRQIFEMVARGDTLGKVAESLRGVPTPRGGSMWYPNTLARIVRNETYKGVYYYGRERVERTPGRKTKVRKTPLPRDQWIAVPVADSGIPHEVIDAARSRLDAKYRPRPTAVNTFELGGMITCSVCGCLITGYSSGPYRYYVCNRRNRNTSQCPEGASWNAGKLEKEVMRRVESFLQDPEAVRITLDKAIEELGSGNPAPWLLKVEDLDRRRAAYQDQQAAGAMTLDELKSRLDTLEEEREFAVSQLRDSEARQTRQDALRSTRNALLEVYRDGILYDGLFYLTAEIRREIYSSLSLTGVLSAQEVELTTEVTEYALRLTKAAQEWAEEQDLYDGQYVADKLLYKGSPVSTVLRLSGTMARVRTTIATDTSTSEEPVSSARLLIDERTNPNPRRGGLEDHAARRAAVVGADPDRAARPRAQGPYRPVGVELDGPRRLRPATARGDDGIGVAAGAVRVEGDVLYLRALRQLPGRGGYSGCQGGVSIVGVVRGLQLDDAVVRPGAGRERRAIVHEHHAPVR
jgi:site-specific DNA recombinase